MSDRALIRITLGLGLVLALDMAWAFLRGPWA